MLQSIRNNSQSSIAKVIVALMIVPFVFFGIDSFFSGGGENYIAEVNGTEISERQLVSAIQNQKARLQSQLGDSFDPEIINDAMLKPQVLESLVQRELYSSTANDMGLVVSDKLLDQQIVSAEEFQENGQFSTQRYEGLLRANGLLASDHRRQLRTQLTSRQLLSGIAQTDFTTPTDLAVTAKVSDERRDIRYISVPTVAAEDIEQPSDEDLASYYGENTEKYMRQPEVQVDYIEVKLSDFYAEVDEAEVKETYEREKAAFEPSIDTSIAHILVTVDDTRDKATALARVEQVLSELAAGKDFAELAKEYSDDSGSANNGGDLGYIQNGLFPEFDEALVGMEVGALSGAVESPSGLHILKLLDQQQSEFASFEASKQRISTELQASGATPAFIARVGELEDESFGSEDLTMAAEVLELEIQTSPFFTRQTGNGVGAYPSVRNVAFSDSFRTESQNSDKIDIGEDRVLVMRLKEFREATPRPLIEVSDSIRTQLSQERLVEANNAKAEKVLQDVRAADSVEQAAKTAGLDWQLQLAADRNTLTIDRGIIDAAFSEGKFVDGSALLVANLSDGSRAVVEVSNVQLGAIDRVSRADRTAMRSSYAQLAGNRAFDDFFKSVRDQADVTIR